MKKNAFSSGLWVRERDRVWGETASGKQKKRVDRQRERNLCECAQEREKGRDWRHQGGNPERDRERERESKMKK